MMKYSASTNSFYDPEIHTNIPSDAVDITDVRYQELMAGQAAGKVIRPGSSGYPQLVDPSTPTPSALEYLPLAGGTMKGTIDFEALTGTASRTLIQGRMASNDVFRIMIGATKDDSGYAEIATADNGSEPIYVRQYSGSGGVFTTLVRSLTLLDALGHSNFPGNVTAVKFIGNLQGTADNATKDSAGRVIKDTYDPILVGEVRWYAGRTVPSGWLLCNGQAVSRTLYPKLFAAIGTVYGKGNGSTTFNLPNLAGKFIQGAAQASDAGTAHEAGLPAITHNHTVTAANAGSHTHTRGTMEILASGFMGETINSGGGGDFANQATGALSYSGSGKYGLDGAIDKNNATGYFKASDAWTGATSSNGSHSHTMTVGNNTTVNAIYGKSSTVQPASLEMLPIIRAA